MIYNEKDYNLALTGYTLVLYKQEFHKDLFTALTKFNNNFDSVSWLEIIWAMLKSSNDNFPNFKNFVSSITDLSTMFTKENIEEMTNVIKSCTTPNSKKK